MYISKEQKKTSTSMIYELTWPFERLLIITTEGQIELMTQVLSVKPYGQGMHTNAWFETHQQISV